jgi:hypothetical protein
VGHIHLPGDLIETKAQNEHRRARAHARLDRGRELFMAGDIDRKRWEAEKARAAADLDALDSTETIVQELPPLDDLWTYAPGGIARILRSIFVRIDLGADMLPSGATWRNPALRRTCDDPACRHCRS